jgi:hypothetical protein
MDFSLMDLNMRYAKNFVCVKKFLKTEVSFKKILKKNAELFMNHT